MRKLCIVFLRTLDVQYFSFGVVYVLIFIATKNQHEYWLSKEYVWVAESVSLALIGYTFMMALVFWVIKRRQMLAVAVWFAIKK